MSVVPTLPRNCGTCACFATDNGQGEPAQVKPNAAVPANTQGLCRLNPPGARRVRAEQPVIVNGNPMIDRNGKPRMEPIEVLELAYPPTVSDAVCWHGWLPRWALPGQTCASALFYPPPALAAANDDNKSILE